MMEDKITGLHIVLEKEYDNKPGEYGEREKELEKIIDAIRQIKGINEVYILAESVTQRMSSELKIKKKVLDLYSEIYNKL